MIIKYINDIFTGMKRLICWNKTNTFDTFDNSSRGFIVSFIGVIITYLVFSAMIMNIGLRPKTIIPFIESIHGIVYMIIYFIIMFFISKFINCRSRYLTYMVSYNWFLVFSNLIVLIICSIVFSFLNNITDTLFITIGCLAMLGMIGKTAYYWFMLRYGLHIESKITIVMLIIGDWLLYVLTRWLGVM
ncbi:MAG: hypothetical protein LBS66_03730, partial [Rhodospirillaceae bacterium]|nr:hypothetical protein [Rhodospirillaceae bacterium]